MLLWLMVISKRLYRFHNTGLRELCKLIWLFALISLKMTTCSLKLNFVLCYVKLFVMFLKLV